jgi:TPR repeat protein
MLFSTWPVLYHDKGELEKAEKYYRDASKKGKVGALNNLANLYSDQKKIKQAEQCYLRAIANGDNDALHNIGIFYSEIGKTRKGGKVLPTCRRKREC